MSQVIFISHSSKDESVAKMLGNFFFVTGISRDYIFCSSLPGNDVDKKISTEIKEKLKNSAINIVILSNNYYKSAYCLNEAGIIWYNEVINDIPIIPIALPEVNETNMYGFLNNEYKLRRLDSEIDISYIYETVCDAIGTNQARLSVITKESKELQCKYNEYLSNRLIPNEQTIPKYLENITTDDERIVLTYILKENVRKVSENEVAEWLKNNEIYDVNIENAFDLLSSQGGELQDKTLTLNIETFREYSKNASFIIQELKPYVDEHTKLASETFENLWRNDSFDLVAKLFIAYIVDEKVSTFGDRWKAELQIKSIAQWENKNVMCGALVNSYKRCLELFKQNNLVYESNWTSYMNPCEYTLHPSLKEMLFASPNQYSEELQKAKDDYFNSLLF